MITPTRTKQPRQQAGTPTSTDSVSLSCASLITRGSRRIPPKPPLEPPPRLKEIVKILCVGLEHDTRRRCMQTLTQRMHSKQGTILDTTPAESMTDFENDSPCSLEYYKKDYTFQSTSGEQRSVRMQFLYLDGTPADTPPKLWQDTRDKIHMALLVVDFHVIKFIWEQGDLDCHLQQWRGMVNTWTNHQLPLNLLMWGVSQDPDSMAPALLLRMGAAVAQACHGARLRSWFMLGSEGSGIEAGLDSADAILQSLVEQASPTTSKTSSGSSTTKSQVKDATNCGSAASSGPPKDST